MKTLVVIPTYNEADNLPLIAAELWALDVAGLEILIVDDNSPDGTGEVAENLALRRPGAVHVIHRPGKAGLGTAYIAGFRRAIELGADQIIQMDADFSHSPLYLPQMVTALEACDVVIGSRYVAGGRLDENWGMGRYLLSWWANSVYSRTILRIQTRDATAGFKCWRADTLRGMDLSRIRSNGYIFQVEMTYVAERLGYRILEIPIHFEDRHRGRSKMTMRVKLEAAWRVWEVWWRHRHLTPIDRVKPEPSSTD
jgi:dolichol-phosphate mannosyltransferase